MDHVAAHHQQNRDGQSTAVHKNGHEEGSYPGEVKVGLQVRLVSRPCKAFLEGLLCIETLNSLDAVECERMRGERGQVFLALPDQQVELVSLI